MRFKHENTLILCCFHQTLLNHISYFLASQLCFYLPSCLLQCECVSSHLNGYLALIIISEPGFKQRRNYSKNCRKTRHVLLPPLLHPNPAVDTWKNFLVIMSRKVLGSAGKKKKKKAQSRTGEKEKKRFFL